MRTPLRVVWIFALLISFAEAGFAQDNSTAPPEAAQAVVAVPQPPPATRLEALQLKKGIVLVRGYTDVATLQAEDGSVRVIAVELNDLSRQVKEFGLALEVSRGERRALCYVDYDEIEAIGSALESIGKLDNNATKLATFEASYRSRGGLDVTSFTDAQGTRMLSIRALQYLDPTGQLVLVTTHLRLSSLPDLTRQLADARAMLDKAKNPD